MCTMIGGGGLVRDIEKNSHAKKLDIDKLY